MVGVPTAVFKSELVISVTTPTFLFVLSTNTFDYLKLIKTDLDPPFEGIRLFDHQIIQNPVVDIV